MWLVNLGGLALIALIVWWFWLYRVQAPEQASGIIRVRVESGSYQPARIAVPAGTDIRLIFLRKDASPCAATLVFDTLEISHELPLDQETLVRLPPLAAGHYPFSCQMRMYKGELVVG